MNLEIDEGSGLHHGQADSFVPPRWCPSMPASWWLQGWSRGLMNTGCRDSNFMCIYIHIMYIHIYIYMYVVWYPLEGALRFFWGKIIGKWYKASQIASLPTLAQPTWRSLARRRHKFVSRLGRPGRPADVSQVAKVGTLRVRKQGLPFWATPFFVGSAESCCCCLCLCCCCCCWWCCCCCCRRWCCCWCWWCCCCWWWWWWCCSLCRCCVNSCHRLEVRVLLCGCVQKCVLSSNLLK